jgi:riboflavin kinase, archaea type
MAQRTEIGFTLKDLILIGTVITGEGNGKRYLSLPWVKQQIEEKLGFIPYAGTLNLKLTRESTKRKEPLLDAKTMVICPAEGHCVGILYKAEIELLECAVIVPEVTNYPKNLLEIIAPLNLRDRLKLEDGNSVEVKVYF